MKVTSNIDENRNLLYHFCNMFMKCKYIWEGTVNRNANLNSPEPKALKKIGDKNFVPDLSSRFNGNLRQPTIFSATTMQLYHKEIYKKPFYLRTIGPP